MARGTLRIYLGAAPGVGKTFAMLNEGWRAQRARHRRRGRVRRDPRPAEHRRRRSATSRSCPASTIEYRGATFEEMDVDAVLARKPDGRAGRRARAHQRARARATRSAGRTSRSCSTPGIDVISTVNIQHLESVNDVVEQITGIKQQETIPDAVVRRGRPDRARRHDARGAAAADGARQHLPGREGRRRRWPTTSAQGNLGALRELALLWVADRVDEALEEYREAHGIAGPWETRERVVVAITGAPGGDDVIRRAARMARAHAGRAARRARAAGRRARRTARASCSSEHRRLLDELGGEYHEVAGADVADGAGAASPGPRTRPSSCSARAASRAGRSCSAAR